MLKKSSKLCLNWSSVIGLGRCKRIRVASIYEEFESEERAITGTLDRTELLD